MLINALIGFLAAVGIFCLMQSVKKAVFSPVPKGGNMRLSTVIAVHGSAPELESTVKALLWLRESGRLDAEIVLRNCGMDADTAEVAEKLAREGSAKLIF